MLLKKLHMCMPSNEFEGLSRLEPVHKYCDPCQSNKDALQVLNEESGNLARQAKHSFQPWQHNYKQAPQGSFNFEMLTSLKLNKNI